MGPQTINPATAWVEPAGVALFAHLFVGGLERRFVERLASFATIEHFAPGGFMARAGAGAGTLYLLTEGQVELRAIDQGSRTGAVYRRGPGEIIGVDGVSTSSQTWTIDAQAIDAVSAIVLDGPTLQRLVEEDRELGLALSFCVCRHVRMRALGRFLAN